MDWPAATNLGGYSKYVNSVVITAAGAALGEITITYNGSNLGYGSTDPTLILAPYINGTDTAGAPYQDTLANAITDGAGGSIDWGCNAGSNTGSNACGVSPSGLGSLLAKHAPSECR